MKENDLITPMKRLLSILLFIIFGTSLAFSQTKDSTKSRLGFSLNVVQCGINEFSVYADYSKNEHSSFGINVGYIYANPSWKVFILSPDQGTFPGTVWNGMVFARITNIRFCWMHRNITKFK